MSLYSTARDIDQSFPGLVGGIRVRASRAGAAVLTSLLDGLDRDIFAETIRDLGLGHQPRERATNCSVCGLETWHPHGTCPQHTDTCEQCVVPGSLEVNP